MLDGRPQARAGTEGQAEQVDLAEAEVPGEDCDVVAERRETERLTGVLGATA
ncbi:MAG TPA: hypothetical protein VFX16_26825 [Pseudonocardiaceae bacterium]|nr:hypothetical protein [Pseudonocardiaceae bacterium]